MTRIIVVEQEVEQREQLLSFLSHAGHDVRGAGNAHELSKRLLRFTPEIVLLDCDLKTQHDTGILLAQQLHDRYGTAIGIVMVTSREEPDERLACRLAGADVYLVKPIVLTELLAAIANLSRRLTPSPREHGWRLFTTKSELVIPGHSPVQLTGWEFVVLHALALARDQQLSRNALISAIGRNPSAYDHRALEAGISRLRRKLPSLENNKQVFQAVRGVGYRFNHPLIIVR